MRVATILMVLACSLMLDAQTEQKQKQEPSAPEYVYKASTRLVILDIVATDAQGKVVSDLKPEEIQILENGKEQNKRDFTFLQPDAEHAAQRVELHLPPDVFTNVPQYKGNSSFNIILFDVLNTRFVNLAYAHDQLIRYFDHAPPNQPTALFALGNKLWLLHDFTTDHQALKESIRRFKGQGAKLVIDSPDEGKSYSRKSTFTTAGADREGTTLDAFRSLARIMSAYKGRKNLIWISESFVVNTMPDIRAPQGPHFLSDYARSIEETADAMMEAQIAIYPIDAFGLSGETFRRVLDRFGEQSALREMADRTGGKAFTSRNDLDIGISASIDDGSSYYSTSYHPSNKTWDGQMRKIELKCSRPGVTLRYRKGYFAVDTAHRPTTKAESRQTSMDFAQALDPDLPVSTALQFQARVLPPSEKSPNKATVDFAVDPHQIAFTKQEDGLEHAEVSCIAWAFPVKGKPIGSGGGTVKAAIDEATFRKVMQSALPCKQSIELPPGNYMLRLGVIDQNTRQIGALTAWLTIPDPAEAAAQKTPEAPVEKK